MDNYISRQAVDEMAYDMSEIDGEHFTEPYMVVDVEDIQKLPSVNPQKKTGHWIHSTKKGVLPDVYTCSVCGWMIDTCRGLMQDTGHRLFCEHCGADMRKSTLLFTKTTGHWIEHYNPEVEICMQHMSECSVCGKMICGRYNIYKNFCPNCGEKMEEQKTT